MRGNTSFSMGFVDGQSLAARIVAGPLPSMQAAHLVHDIAEAVQFAHEKGVVHRDLKPGNILLDGDGKPRVTDFGLAKLTISDSGLTVSGDTLGTPSYMPPEQVAMKAEQVGPALDVYSLGAILYSSSYGPSSVSGGEPHGYPATGPREGACFDQAAQPASSP